MQPEKAPLPPKEQRGLTVSRSPRVDRGTISTSRPFSRSGRAIRSACSSARALPLVSSLMGGSPFLQSCLRGFAGAVF
jgi:hypothetical protein